MKRAVITKLVICIVLLFQLQWAAAADTTWLREAKYGLMVHYFPGVTDITGNYWDGSWNDTVNDFNVVNFADQVEQTGAGYVLFTVGATNGYYCTGNYWFQQYTGHGPGTYCSIRDMIGDVADALDDRGIKLMVYIAAEGPHRAIHQSGSTNYYVTGYVNPLLNYGFACLNREATSDFFRAKFNMMVCEWSNQWVNRGDKVAGWWLDGCFAAGYDDPQHLTDLIAACRGAGNSDALIACNPSTWNNNFYEGMNPNADYLAGEDNVLGRYPLHSWVNSNGVQMQWNVTSFLGDSWGTPGTRYSTYYLASYVKGVTDAGGVVTLDCAVDQDGDIDPAHLAQMSEVKAYVRDGVPLDVSPDRAYLKPSHLLDNVKRFPACLAIEFAAIEKARGGSITGHPFRFFRLL